MQEFLRVRARSGGSNRKLLENFTAVWAPRLVVGSRRACTTAIDCRWRWERFQRSALEVRRRLFSMNEIRWMGGRVGTNVSTEFLRRNPVLTLGLDLGRLCSMRSER